MNIEDIKVGSILKLTDEMPFFYLDCDGEGNTVKAAKGALVEVVSVCPADDSRSIKSSDWDFIVVTYCDENLYEDSYSLVADWMLEEV